MLIQRVSRGELRRASRARVPRLVRMIMPVVLLQPVCRREGRIAEDALLHRARRPRRGRTRTGQLSSSGAHPVHESNVTLAAMLAVEPHLAARAFVWLHGRALAVPHVGPLEAGAHRGSAHAARHLLVVRALAIRGGCRRGRTASGGGACARRAGAVRRCARGGQRCRSARRPRRTGWCGGARRRRCLPARGATARRVRA